MAQRKPNPGIGTAPKKLSRFLVSNTSPLYYAGMSRVHPGTLRISYNGDATLAVDLVLSDFLTVSVDRRRLILTLHPATRSDEGCVPLKYYSPRTTPIMHFRRALKAMGLTAFEAAGIYKGKRVGKAVVVDMQKKFRVKGGALHPVTSTRHPRPYGRGSCIAQAYAMCRRGTTISKLVDFARTHQVSEGWLLYHVSSKWRHGCTVVRDGEHLLLMTPAESQRCHSYRGKVKKPQGLRH